MHLNAFKAKQKSEVRLLTILTSTSGVCWAESSKENIPCPPRGQRVTRGHYPYRQLIPLPRTYFEVKDVRPGEEESQWISDKIFVLNAGGISIPKELNQNIL